MIPRCLLITWGRHLHAGLLVGLMRLRTQVPMHQCETVLLSQEVIKKTQSHHNVIFPLIFWLLTFGLVLIMNTFNCFITVMINCAQVKPLWKRTIPSEGFIWLYLGRILNKDIKLLNLARLAGQPFYILKNPGVIFILGFFWKYKNLTLCFFSQHVLDCCFIYMIHCATRQYWK